MWITQGCRCIQSLKVAPSKLLGSNTSVHSHLASRQLITSVRTIKNNKGLNKGFTLRDLIKSNGIIARFCSTSPKPKQNKVVGYWLLGCSGMVFTAVVLGMVAGYLTLLFSICYIINIVVSTTNGSK